MKRININLENICKISELGVEFSLPYSEKIAKALTTLEEACHKEIMRRKEYLLQEYLYEKTYYLINGDHYTSPDRIKSILKETYEYGRNSK